ncbi:MAG: hypothetical protein LLF92_10995 [Planctomycetaceae bacterium]|nr:hypothetical protein [Planctomycetaceae bacterium]
MKKHETRNPKYETNSEPEFLNVQNDRSLKHLNFGNLNLFRISKLDIRILVMTLSLLAMSGCQVSEKAPEKHFGIFQKASIFVPQKISFNQLTEFSKPWQITAYIDVSDQFNSRLKAQGIWQFELYSKVQRSADPAGGRIKLWPDFDLTDAKENNLLWQDYLRCYKFELNLDSELTGTYVLEAVCFTAEGKRLSDRIELKR